MSEYILDDLSYSLDIKEDDKKVTKVRTHIVITVHEQVKADIPGNTSDVGELQQSVTYHVGSIIRSNNPAGAGQFICVADGMSPIGHPGDYVNRRKTFEYFGPWETAPAEWNV